MINTLEEAYAITSKMTREEDRKPTELQSEAKWFIYRNVIRPNYENAEDVPPHLEPDFMEGWS